MFFSILLILLIIFAIGLPLSLLISPKMNAFARIGISFPLGIGIFTLAMFVGNQLGFRFSITNAIIIFSILSILLIIAQRKRIKGYFASLLALFRNANFSPFEKITLTALGFFVISSFLNTFYWPVHSWDSIILYDFRAKIFAESGFIKDAMIGYYYTGYPLLTSLSHTLVYLFGGKNPQFIYSLFYLSLGLCFYGLLIEFLSRRSSLFYTLILLTVPIIFDHSLISYTNLPYTTFLSIGAIYFCVWLKKKTQGYLVISAILVGLSAWTRPTEPYYLGIFAIVFLVSVLKRKFRDIVVYSIFLFPISQAWNLYRKSLPFMEGSTSTGIGYLEIFRNILDFDRWLKVIAFLNQNVIQSWGLVFIVFVLMLILSFGIRKEISTILVFVTTILFFLLLIVGTFFYSFIETGWVFWGDAATRTSMIFYPLFIYAIAMVGKNKY